MYPYIYPYEQARGVHDNDEDDDDDDDLHPQKIPFYMKSQCICFISTNNTNILILIYNILLGYMQIFKIHS